MKKSIFFAVFSILSLISFAQNSNNYEDVVYLKNGSIYRGLIIEQIPNVSLKIQSQDRNVFAVQMSEVEKITKEEKPTRAYRNENSSITSSEGAHAKREYKPTKLNGFYMNWGIGVGGSPDNAGFILNMDLGGKIFSKKKTANTDKRVFVGGDVFGNIGGMFGFNSSFMTGVYGGPTIAFKLRKGNIYLTPHTGICFNGGRDRTRPHYYETYEEYINSYPYHSTFINVSLPVGMKFEYNYRHFICGATTNLGFDFTGGFAGKIFGFAGVKF